MATISPLKAQERTRARRPRQAEQQAEQQAVEFLENQYYQVLRHVEIKQRGDNFPTFQYDYPGRHILYRHVNDHVLRNRPIDYLEFGVFQGDSMRQWTSINTREESRFFGFDSFEGLPTDWEDGGRKKGDFTVHGNIPDIKDPRVSFHKGWFNQTLLPFLDTFTPRNQLVLHLDADLYSSTLYVLMHVHRILKNGTVLVFDDFGPRDDFAALHHYAKAMSRNWTILAARQDFIKLAAVLH